MTRNALSSMLRSFKSKLEVIRVKWNKGLAAILIASIVLAACGSEEAEKEQVVEEQQVETLQAAEETAQFVAFVEAQMDDFVLDTELLAGYVTEGKLKEAQKLLPLTAMYMERMQPLAPQLELATQIRGEIIENQATSGFERLAFGLFNEKKTKGYEQVAQQLVIDIKALQVELSELEFDGQQLLSGSSAMIEDTLANRLPGSSDAHAEVYAVKAQTEAVEELVKIFMSRADTEKAAAVVEQTATLNEILTYYEVGKEDYVNYSFFTSTQKQELSDALQAVNNAWQELVETIK